MLGGVAGAPEQSGPLCRFLFVEFCVYASFRFFAKDDVRVSLVV